MSNGTSTEAQVVVATSAFTEDLAALTTRFGFRLDEIYPADAPSTAMLSGHGLRLRLERSAAPNVVTIDVHTDEPSAVVELPGGSVVRLVPHPGPFELPDNMPSLTITTKGGDSGVGRAGMHYRDLIPDRWGGRFISSHITIVDGGPVPDNVHYHRLRFQMIFVKTGWVRLVYEDQGPPFVMNRGDCVLQPPEIRHRVLESSPGLEVIEISCPAGHRTILDWDLPLPTPNRRPDRRFDGQAFVLHVAADARHAPWRLPGWEHQDTGIEQATRGLAGARVARPDGTPTTDSWVTHDTEFAQLVTVRGAVTFETDEVETRLTDSDSVAIPGGLRYRLSEPTDDCELLDVTLPGAFAVTTLD